jgi:hypothetical protein
MQRHTEMVEKQGGPSNRDDLLTHRYVRRLERKIRRSVYELDDDDAISIGLWVENNQDCVFFYEDFSDTDTTPTLAFFFSFLFSKFLRLDHKTCFFGCGLQTEAAKPVLGEYYKEPKKSGALPWHLFRVLAVWHRA